MPDQKPPDHDPLRIRRTWKQYAVLMLTVAIGSIAMVAFARFLIHLAAR